jgi:hypothetical protein
MTRLPAGCRVVASLGPPMPQHDAVFRPSLDRGNPRRCGQFIILDADQLLDNLSGLVQSVRW